MKGSDQCALMAELAAAETTVSHGENQKGSRQRCGCNTDGGERGETGEAGGGSYLLSFHVLDFYRVFIDTKYI